MKKAGEITKFDGRNGIINDKTEEFDFHLRDLSEKNQSEPIHLGDKVEFRAEYRDYNVKIAKNIKVLQKRQ